MHSIYHSESVNWSSDTKKGTRKVVSIKNGKGTRLNETFNAQGKVIQRHRNTLKKGEIDRIMKGKFIPNLWKNRNSIKSRTRKSTRRKPSA